MRATVPSSLFATQTEPAENDALVGSACCDPDSVLGRGQPAHVSTNRHPRPDRPGTGVNSEQRGPCAGPRSRWIDRLLAGENPEPARGCGDRSRAGVPDPDGGAMLRWRGRAEGWDG